MRLNTFLLFTVIIIQLGTVALIVAPPQVAVSPEKRLEVEVVLPTTDMPIALSPSWPPEIRQWREEIVDTARQYRMDPNLIAAVIMVESGGNPNAVSRAGARGLMQIMPLHSCWSFEPRRNIECGTFILATYYHQMGNDWRGGLAAYNCGITGAKRNDCGARGGWVYADTVLGLWGRYRP